MIRKLLVIIIILSLIATVACDPISGSGSKKTSTPSAPTTPLTPTPEPITVNSLKLSLDALQGRITALEKNQSSPDPNVSLLQKQLTDLTTKVNTMATALVASPTSTTPTSATPAPSAITEMQNQIKSLYQSLSTLYRVSAGVTSNNPSYIGANNSALLLNSPLGWYAQTFTTTAAGVFSGFNALFSTVGKPGNINFYLISLPSQLGTFTYNGTYISTGYIDSAVFTNTYGPWYNIPMSICNVSANSVYAILVNVPRADGTNNIGSAADGVNPSYAGGKVYISTDGGKVFNTRVPSTDITFVANIETPSTGGTSTPAAGTIISLTITPSSTVVSVGGVQQFTATAIYSNGATANITTSVVWVSQSTAVLNIGYNTGVATGVGIGGTTVAAYLLGTGGSVQLSATPVSVTVH